MVWYSHLFQNFPQFIVIHTVKDFSIVNEAELDEFLNYLAFSMNKTSGGDRIPVELFHILEDVAVKVLH